MFKTRDKVFDSKTHQIGTVIFIDRSAKYPIEVRFPDSAETYTASGEYNTGAGIRHIKKIEDITGTVQVGSTHIYIAFSHSTYLLPKALTSFKLVNGIIIATYNGQACTVYTDNIGQIIDQLQNTIKKESL